MFKLSVTGYVVYGVVRDAMALVVATINGDANLTMQVMGELVYRVVQQGDAAADRASPSSTSGGSGTRT
jgi:uncharacterized membrane protein